MKTQQNTLPKVVSALTARTQLGQILRRVKSNKERFLISKNGEPQAVVMSIEDYIDTVAPAPDWLKSAWAESKKNGTDKLTMRDIDAIIAGDRAQVARKSTKVRSK
jgi:prevent-host-death family protein